MGDLSNKELARRASLQLMRELEGRKGILEDIDGEVLGELMEALAARVEPFLDQASELPYTERNQVVAGLARAAAALGGRAWRAQHPDDPNWDPRWRTIVFIELPGGAQLSWHFPTENCALIDWLPEGPNSWDGHTTPDKYARLDRFARTLFVAPTLPCGHPEAAAEGGGQGPEGKARSCGWCADLELARETGAREEREACAQIAEAAPLSPDTRVGTRQRDLKARIAAGIRARGAR